MREGTLLGRNTVMASVYFLAIQQQRSLLMAGDDDEMFMTRSLNVTPKTTMWHVAVWWHVIESAQTFAILEFYFRFGFRVDHITVVDMSFCTSLRNCIQIGPPSAEKMTSCRFSRWRISAILDFRDPIMGSLKIPCTISYRSSIETIALNGLVFF